MSSKNYLTIKDFPKEGSNFKTEVDLVTMGIKTNSGSADLSPKTLVQTHKPLSITRKKDKFTFDFQMLAIKQSPKKFPEASLTLDIYGPKGGLRSRMIYDFFDFELTSYIEGGDMEQMQFDFAKASAFYSSVESITSP